VRELLKDCAMSVDDVRSRFPVCAMVLKWTLFTLRFPTRIRSGADAEADSDFG
jgi:hypothetical protein